MALGMMMLSPTIVSMPFKLLLFVLVDGWALTMGSLAASFAIYWDQTPHRTLDTSSASRSGVVVTGARAAPILMPALLTGILIGMVQAATSINEATLSFVPKLHRRRPLPGLVRRRRS